MKLHVLINYGGRLTKERRILPGEYDATDPKLFGLAQYLVDNGHAKWAGEQEIEDAPVSADEMEDLRNGEAVYVDVEELEAEVAELMEPSVDVTVEDVSVVDPLTEDFEDEIEDGIPEIFDPETATVADLHDAIAAYGVDLDALEGSGAGGRLVKADLINIYKKVAE